MNKTVKERKTKKTKSKNIDEMFNDCTVILSKEIDKIAKLQSNSEELLDPKAVAVLTDTMRTFISYKKEERVASLNNDLSKIDENSLKDLAKTAIQFIEKKEKQ